MGGGVLRGISRVIGTTGVGGRFGFGATVNSPAQQVAIINNNNTHSWGDAEKQELILSSSSAAPPFTVIDDWEFAGDEDEFQTHKHVHLDQNPHVRDRLIFGSVPTHQEVMEATSDLQDALKQIITPVSGTFDHEKVSPTFLPVHDNPDVVEALNIQGTECKSENSVNQVVPEFDQDNDKVVQKSGHSNVLEAFNLFQKNRAVQGVVVSLASDKAVWDAVLKNEKVQDFRQSFLKGESELPDSNTDADKPTCYQKNRFLEAIGNMKEKLMGYMEKIMEISNQFLGFADNVFSDKDGVVERALKASSMLAVAVLLIVLIKRLLVK